MLDLLTSLVDKSLVLAEQKHGHTRYRMLETIRQYSRDRLLDRGTGDAVRDKHLDYFLALAERERSQVEGSNPKTAIAALEEELENLRASLDWSLQTQDSMVPLRLCSALCLFWNMNYPMEGVVWCQRILELASAKEHTQERMEILLYLLNYVPTDSIEHKIEEDYALSETLGDKYGVARYKHAFAVRARFQGRFDDAQRYLDESLQLFRELGDTTRIAFNLYERSRFQFQQGDSALSEHYSQEARHLFTSLGNKRGSAHVLFSQGFRALFGENDPAKARSLLEDAHTFYLEMGNKGGISQVQFYLGAMAVCQSNLTVARQHLDVAYALIKELDTVFLLPQTQLLLGVVAYGEGDFDQGRQFFRSSILVSDGSPPGQFALDLLTCRSFASICLGEWEQAALFYGAIYGVRLQLAETAHLPLAPVIREWLERDLAPARLALGEEAFTDAVERGRKLTLEQAVALALTFSPDAHA